MNQVKTKLEQIMREVNTVLAAVGEKHGISLIAGGGTYEMDGSFTVKLRGVPKDRKVAVATRNGMVDNIIGRSFMSNGRKFTIEDHNPRRWKKPVIASTPGDSRRYIFTESVLSILLPTTP